MTRKEKEIKRINGMFIEKYPNIPPIQIRIGTCSSRTNGLFFSGQWFNRGTLYKNPSITIDHYVPVNDITRVVLHELGHYINWVNKVVFDKQWMSEMSADSFASSF